MYLKNINKIPPVPFGTGGCVSAVMWPPSACGYIEDEERHQQPVSKETDDSQDCEKHMTSFL